MKGKSGFIIAVLLLLMVLGLLVKYPPDSEIKDLQEKLKASNAKEAPINISGLYNAANDSLTSALNEIYRQKSKSILTRNYDVARQKLKEAKELAQKADILVSQTK